VLQLMRKHAKSWLIKIILGIIIIVFIFYFGSIREKRQAESIAIIDNQSISYGNFWDEYQGLVNLYRQRFGNNLTDDVLKKLNLKKQALDNLINRAIIIRKADELKLSVNDGEIRDSIRSHPAFHKNGVFDDQVYQRTLRHYKMSPEDFEASQKMELKIAKLEELITKSVKVSEEEIYDIYRIQNEKINLEFIKIAAGSFKSRVKPTDIDLRKHFEEDSGLFRIPEKAQIKYIEFTGTDFAEHVKVSENDVTDYYNLHKNKYTKQGGEALPLSEAKSSIITEIKRTKGARTALREARKAHDTIYQEENFEDYASTNGLKINITGFFARANPPGELSRIDDIAQHVFGLRAGEISPVLSASKGFYVIKAVSTNPSYIPKFEEAKKDVEKNFIDKESQILCRKEAEMILRRLKDGENIGSFSRSKGIEISETGLFIPNPNIPKIGFSRELEESLCRISEKRPYPDNVFYVNGNSVIIKLKEKGKLDDGDFEAKKANLKNILLKIKGDECFRSWIDGIRISMTKEGKIKMTTQADSL